jgi:type IV secretory pathway TraG/TraD family ATPase VirD4
VNEPGNHPCALVVDELPTLYMHKLDNLIATARSNKVAVVLGLQEVTQLQQLQGKETAATITSITRFGMHADLIDKFHARKVADMTGQVELELENEGVLSVETRSIGC